jgi:hypothetical protein
MMLLAGTAEGFHTTSSLPQSAAGTNPAADTIRLPHPLGSKICPGGGPSKGLFKNLAVH